MEHPDVIRDIDALIESYNWPEIVHNPNKFVGMLKQSFRTQSTEIFFDLYNSDSHAQFFILHLLLQLLRHPGVMHKQWILESISHLTTVAMRQRRDSSALVLEKRRVFREGETLLRRYTRHRVTAYRCHAVTALAQLMPNHDLMVRCYLDAVRRERSFQNIFRIFDYLGAIFLKHPDYLVDINPQTKSAALRHLETLSAHHSPLMRLAASAVVVQILQKDTPQTVLDCLAANWSFLDAHKKTHWKMIAVVLHCIHLLGRAAFVNVLAALLVNSRTFIVALEVWQDIEHYYFVDAKNARLTTFTHNEKMLTEALIRCKPLWRTRRVVASVWNHREIFEFRPDDQGLEPTRAALIQQLKHAGFIDEMERYSNPADINLISYPTIDC